MNETHRADVASDRKGLSTDDVARVYGIPKNTLIYWRYRDLGPAYSKVGPGKGGRVLYRPSDIERWLDAHRVDPAASVP